MSGGSNISYWSSTTSVYNSGDGAWVVDLENLGHDGSLGKTSLQYAACAAGSRHNPASQSAQASSASSVQTSSASSIYVAVSSISSASSDVSSVPVASSSVAVSSSAYASSAAASSQNSSAASDVVATPFGGGFGPLLAFVFGLSAFAFLSGRRLA